MSEDCLIPEEPGRYTIVRKRFIPDECLVLDKDRVFRLASGAVVTAWDVLKPRTDISRGISVYYPERGFKISKVYNLQQQLHYWYCDIIRAELLPQQLRYEDLLLDVIILPDGQVQVLDADELAAALEQSLISEDVACLALRQLNELLSFIYSGRFCELQQPILALEKLLCSHTP